MSANYIMVAQPYGLWWRRQRRVVHNHFHPNIVAKYRDRQMKAAHTFLLCLLESPDKLMENIRQQVKTLILPTFSKCTI